MPAMRPALFVAVSLLALAACAPVNDTVDGTTSDASAAPPMSSPMPAEPAPQPPSASPMPTESTPQSPPVDMEDPCQADAAKPFIGKTATANVVEQARNAANARTARTLKPGQMVTMEYAAGRLNLDVDENNVIVAARCG